MEENVKLHKKKNQKPKIKNDRIEMGFLQSLFLSAYYSAIFLLHLFFNMYYVRMWWFFFFLVNAKWNELLNFEPNTSNFLVYIIVFYLDVSPQTICHLQNCFDKKKKKNIWNKLQLKSIKFMHVMFHRAMLPMSLGYIKCDRLFHITHLHFGKILFFFSLHK